MDNWTLYQGVTLALFVAGIGCILVALYANWQIFSSYGTGDLWAGLAAATAIWLLISLTWPLSLPALLIYRLYLWWEHRNGSPLAGDR
jgi:hypothetical protein